MRIRKLLAVTATLALTLAACGGGEEDGDGAEAGGSTDESTAAGGEATDGDDASSGDEAAVPADGPTITVASFNFTESVILAETYAQALEDAGYPVERQLELGSREVIFPELTGGAVDLLPEYVGSALGVGFGGDPTSDLDETLSALTSAFESEGVVVLEPAPGENKNVYVVTSEFADTNGVGAIPDLADVGDVTLGGPPECEGRANCYAGLSGDPYDLGNLSFTGIPEGSVRIASLRNGEIEVSTLFSTQPVIEQEGFVVLDDPEGIVAVENIVPVVSREVADAYGQDMVDLVNRVSEAITTEALIDLNGRVEIDAQNPADVAADFLTTQNLVG